MEDQTVLLPGRPDIEVSTGPQGHVIIRQDAFVDGDDDAAVVLLPYEVHLLIAALQKVAGLATP